MLKFFIILMGLAILVGCGKKSDYVPPEQPTLETRCAAGFLVLIDRINGNRQILNPQGGGVPCQ